MKSIKELYDGFIEACVNAEYFEYQEQLRDAAMYRSYIEDMRSQAYDKYGMSARDIEHERDRGHTWGEGIDDVEEEPEDVKADFRKSVIARFPWLMDYITAILDRNLDEEYIPHLLDIWNIEEYVEPVINNFSFQEIIDTLITMADEAMKRATERANEDECLPFV